MRGLMVVVVVAACGFNPRTAFLDSGVPNDPDATTPGDAPLAPWGSAALLFDNGGAAHNPTLTGDMLELYFDNGLDIYTTTRTSTDQPFGAATLESTLSSTSLELTPELSYDGLTVYFSSDHNPGDGDTNIWMSTRTSTTDEWATPTQVSQLSSDHTNDAAATPSANSLSIVENYDEPANNVNIDIYESTRTTTSAVWGTPMPLANVNSAADDDNPMLSADQLELYFDSNRAGGDQLYVATRPSTGDTFTSPTLVDQTGALEGESAPWISQDSHHLVFEHDGRFYEISR